MKSNRISMVQDLFLGERYGALPSKKLDVLFMPG
jgi:hypothetical protein